VINNNGGAATVADFPLKADGTGTNDLSGTDPVDSDGTLKADTQSSARCDVDFKADETKVEAKGISFGQTVVNQLGQKNFYAGATPADPEKNKSTYTPFEEATTKKRMDHMPDTENDPFYGAEWDQTQKKWVKESDDYVPGSSQKGVSSTSAKMFDIPGAGVAREGLGDASKQFETVPMILETRQPLGSLSWGFKIKDEANAPIELTGGKQDDCVDTPSADWGATMDQFYVGKFAEILDDFDIAKSDLKPDHKTKLDSIVTKLKANAALSAQFGGAADLTGDQKFNEELSLKRATNARDYVVSKGIDAGRTELQSYGSDWARVEAEAGKSEGKNDVAARIGYNRLGVDLRTERPRPARIREAVRQVLADPTYTANVGAVRAELLSYDPGARIEAALHDESLASP